MGENITRREITFRANLEVLQWLAKKCLIQYMYIIIIVYRWARNHLQKVTVDLCLFCREICVQSLMKNQIVKVEVESTFFQSKYNHGQHQDEHWVFGGLERDT